METASGPRLFVIGMGPGSSILSPQASELAFESQVVIFRTLIHPGAQGLADELSASGIVVETMDDLYDAYDDFASVYQEIASRLEAAVLSFVGGQVTYVVPGSPLVGESAVYSLVRGSIEVVPIAAPSFLDLVWTALERDPAEGLGIVDCATLLGDPGSYGGPLLVMQCHSTPLVGDIIARLSQQRESKLCVLHHLGASDEMVSWLDADSDELVITPDHLTSIFVPNWESPSTAFSQLWEIIRTLRLRCPWDAEQTHESLAKHLLEESYETLDAVYEVTEAPDEASSTAALSHLQEELGDLMIQIMFHANLAREVDAFSIDDVCELTAQKLIRRHPHVFGDVVVTEAEEVVRNWEAIKMTESHRSSTLDGIPRDLPSGARYQKLARKVRVRSEMDSAHDTEVLRHVLGEMEADNGAPLDVSDLESLLRATLRLGIAAKLDVDTILTRFNRELEREILEQEASEVDRDTPI